MSIWDLVSSDIDNVFFTDFKKDALVKKRTDPVETDPLPILVTVQYMADPTLFSGITSGSADVALIEIKSSDFLPEYGDKITIDEVIWYVRKITNKRNGMLYQVLATKDEKAVIL